jgi:hypothetical protein
MVSTNDILTAASSGALDLAENVVCAEMRRRGVGVDEDDMELLAVRGYIAVLRHKASVGESGPVRAEDVKAMMLVPANWDHLGALQALVACDMDPSFAGTPVSGLVVGTPASKTAAAVHLEVCRMILKNTRRRTRR